MSPSEQEVARTWGHCRGSSGELDPQAAALMLCNLSR